MKNYKKSENIKNAGGSRFLEFTLIVLELYFLILRIIDNKL